MITAEQYRRALDVYAATLRTDPAHDPIVSALRIAIAVATPGVLEGAVLRTGGLGYKGEAAAIAREIMARMAYPLRIQMGTWLPDAIAAALRAYANERLEEADYLRHHHELCDRIDALNTELAEARAKYEVMCASLDVAQSETAKLRAYAAEEREALAVHFERLTKPVEPAQIAFLIRGQSHD